MTAVRLARRRRRAALPLPARARRGRARPPVRAGRRRPLSLAGLVAELRRTAADPTQPDDLRRAAAHRLAAPRRRPRSTAGPWCPPPTPRRGGACAPRAGPRPPVRPDDEPVRLSASALQGLLTCPAQWFLEREAGGSGRQLDGAGLRHRRARPRRPGRQGRARPAADVDDLMALVDEVWDRIVVPDAVVRRARARGRPRRAGPLRRLADRGRAPARRCSPPRAGSPPTVDAARRPAGAPDRLRRPARARRRRRRRGRRPQDRQVPPDRHRRSPRTPSSASTSSRSNHGAVDEVVGRAGPRPGAPSWSSCGSARELPKVQPQAPQVPGDDGVTAIERQLMAAVAAVRDEEFVARPGDHCDRCDFHADLPGQVRRVGALVTHADRHARAAPRGDAAPTSPSAPSSSPRSPRRSSRRSSSPGRARARPP